MLADGARRAGPVNDGGRRETTPDVAGNSVAVVTCCNLGGGMVIGAVKV